MWLVVLVTRLDRAPFVVIRTQGSIRVFVHRLKLDVVISQQAFIPVKTVQERSFWEPRPPLTRPQCGSRHALRAGVDALRAGEAPLALDLALLAKHTS